MSIRQEVLAGLVRMPMAGADLTNSQLDRALDMLKDQVLEAEDDVALLAGFAEALQELTREYPWVMMSEWTGRLLDELINVVPSEAEQRAHTARQVLGSVNRPAGPQIVGDGG